MWPMHQPEGDDELALDRHNLYVAIQNFMDSYDRFTSKFGLNALLMAAKEREEGSD